MRKFTVFFMVLLSLCLFLSGCGKIKGPRFWWDDRGQERLSEDYTLPDDPTSPADAGKEVKGDAAGNDLTDQNLRDYRTDLDAEEQKSQERFVPEGFNQALEGKH